MIYHFYVLIIRDLEDLEVNASTVLPVDKNKDSSNSSSSGSNESTPDPLPSESVNPLSDTTTTHHTTDTIPVEEWPSLTKNGVAAFHNPPSLLSPPSPPPSPPPGFTNEPSSSAKTDKTKGPVERTNVKASTKGITEPANVRVPVEGLSVKDKEDTSNDIFEIALALLDNNKKKISLFRNSSGLYQRGEISVSEYYQQCSSLFGTSWTSIGLHIAKTLPDPVKRNELHEMFVSDEQWPPPPPGLSKPPGLSYPLTKPPGLVSNKKNNKKNKASKSQQQQSNGSKVWDTVRPPHKVSLNDEEFPSLQKASTMPDPVTAPPKWNQKVAVVK